MKLAYLFFSLLIISSSCSPVFLVNREDLKKIPYGSTKVISRTDAPVDETFSTVSKVFAKSGCPVKTDKESMQIVCDGISVEGGTSLKVMAFVEPGEGGTLVTMSGQWGLDASGQAGMAAFGAYGVSGMNKLVWEGIQGTKPCVAFQHMILMSIAIPGSQQRYSK